MSSRRGLAALAYRLSSGPFCVRRVPVSTAAVIMIRFTSFTKPCNVKICAVQARVFDTFSHLVGLRQDPILGYNNGTRFMLLL